MKVNDVEPSSVKAERLQTRAQPNSDYVDELAERMAAGDKFPPIVVFSDGTDSWLADGSHRLDAASKANVEIAVDKRQGTRADAVKFACGANAAHGLRRTNEDKRRSVELALSEFPHLASRLIADFCGVSHVFVGTVRQVVTVNTTAAEQAIQASNGQPKRIGKDGRQQAATKRHQAKEEAAGPVPASGVAGAVDRQWGEGDSLEDVRADLNELVRRCRDLNRFARVILRCEKDEITRPYCGEYSLLTVSHPLLHIARVLENDMPVGGTPKRPLLYREQKAKELT